MKWEMKLRHQVLGGLLITLFLCSWSLSIPVSLAEVEPDGGCVPVREWIPVTIRMQEIITERPGYYEVKANVDVKTWSRLWTMANGYPSKAYILRLELYTGGNWVCVQYEFNSLQLGWIETFFPWAYANGISNTFIVSQQGLYRLRATIDHRKLDCYIDGEYILPETGSTPPFALS